MFYCQQCNNMFDITKKLPDTTMSGGKNGSSSTITTQTGGERVEDVLNNILTKKNVLYKDIQAVGIDNIIKHKDYKKLNRKSKEIVYNTIQSIIPLKDKKIMDILKQTQKVNTQGYFLCTNCGFSSSINPGTIIYSKKKSSISYANNSNLNENRDYIHHNYLLRTKRFRCPNNKCTSFNNVDNQEAVIYRMKDTHNTRYMCTTCGTSISN